MKNTNYFLGIMMVIVGLMMCMAAEPIIMVLVIVLGISALAEGVFVLTSVMPLIDERPFKIECAVRAAISVIIGLLCVILPLRMATFVWQVMIYIFAIYALISAALGIAIVLRLRSEGFPMKRYVIEIAASIVLALILFALPSSFGFTLIRLGGVLMILAGGITTFVAWKNRDIVIETVEVRDADDEE
ncbi:MAG: hypothetical protein J1E59_00645 [Treponema sp.]|nr:hypothetical protein [Treponema sp.]